MGCSSCKTDASSTNNITRLMEAIERENISSIEFLLRLISVSDNIDLEVLLKMPIIKSHSVILTVPCYSVWVGKSKSYFFIIERLQVCIKDIEDYFISIGTNLLAILCERGNLEIFKHYLPHYLSDNNVKISKDKSYTLSFTIRRGSTETQKIFLSPIQLLCAYRHIHIIHYINDYFSIKYPPPSLDVHFIDEETGENCALISVRTGYFPLLKYLFESTEADFHLKNSYGEGAFQILAATSRFNYSVEYLTCAEYLVEVVKVDVSYMYEETLLLLENRDLIKFFEGKLAEKGVSISKKDLEDINKIKIYQREERLKNSNIVGDSHAISSINTVSFLSKHDISFN